MEERILEQELLLNAYKKNVEIKSIITNNTVDMEVDDDIHMKKHDITESNERNLDNFIPSQNTEK